MNDMLHPYAEYKDSGVPWIGKIPAHWEMRRLKALARNINDQGRFDGDAYVALEHVESWTGRLQLSQGDIIGESQVKRFLHNDILFGKLRPYLAKVTRPSFDGVCVGEFLIFRTFGGLILPEFLENVLRSKNFIDVVNSSTFGAKMPRADWSFIGNVILCFPPDHSEQSAIVRYLDHVDRRIRNYIRVKRRMIELLNEQKQAIITRAVTRGLDPNVRLKASGIDWLGDVPEHWEVTQLRRNWEVVDCKHLTVPFVEDGIPLASVSEVQSFDLNLSQSNRTTQEWYSELILGGRKPKRGDLIYCRNVSVGACAYVNTDEDFAMGQDVCLIRSDRQNQRYFNHLLRSGFMRQQTGQLLVGSTFNRINISEIKSLLVLVPPRVEQDSVAEFLDARITALESPISSVKCEIDAIREYRARLIADVVTGKVDVREAAARLPDDAEEFVEQEPLKDPNDELNADIDEALPSDVPEAEEYA